MKTITVNPKEMLLERAQAIHVSEEWFFTDHWPSSENKIVQKYHIATIRSLGRLCEEGCTEISLMSE